MAGVGDVLIPVDSNVVSMMEVALVDFMKHHHRNGKFIDTLHWELFVAADGNGGAASK